MAHRTYWILGTVVCMMMASPVAAPSAAGESISCYTLTNCKDCVAQASENDCIWCVSPLRMPPNDAPHCVHTSDKPYCAAALTRRFDRCPVCETLASCDTCLKYPGFNSDGCLWCFEGTPTPRCITDTKSGEKAEGCTAWHGASPKECPASD